MKLLDQHLDRALLVLRWMVAIMLVNGGMKASSLGNNVMAYVMFAFAMFWLDRALHKKPKAVSDPEAIGAEGLRK